MFVIIFTVVLASTIVGWLAAMYYINDFSVPQSQVPPIKHALVIFPHADDETNIAGLLWMLGKRGIRTTFVVLTRGENGTADTHLDLKLKHIRASEMKGVCDRLCGGELIQEDFGDGQLGARRAELKRYITQLLAKTQVDLVITYDLAGLYGHEDHIVCSEIATELLRRNHPSTALWYCAWPRRMLAASHLPTHMAKDPHFANRRARPTMRFFIGRGVFAKIRSVYDHKSQRRSFRSMMPLGLPIWLVYSLQVFEYYERIQ